MSYVLLHADHHGTVLADDPLVPAAEVGAVREAAALLAEARAMRDATEAETTGARARAFDAGHAEGLEQGRVAAAEAANAAMLRLTADAQAAEARRQGEVARLAIEVLRRIAGDLGEPVVIAALAERAAASVGNDTDAVVRVPPDALEVVRARLGERPGLSVEADPAIAGTDCVVETSLGSVHAGLETQLAAIERAWGRA